MLINGSAINFASINGEGVNTYNEAISEALSLTVGTFDNGYGRIVNEVLTLSGTTSKGFQKIIDEIISVIAPLTFTYKYQSIAIDIITITTSLSSRSNLKSAITNSLVTEDLLKVSYNDIISDTLSIIPTLSLLFKKLESLQESIILSSTIDNRAIFAKSIISSISILEEVLYSKHLEIIDSFIILESLNSLHKLLETAVSSLIIDSSLSEFSSIFVFNNDNIDINEEVNNRSVLNTSTIDSIVFKIPSISGDNEYLTYVLAPENNAVFNYNNYNFNGCTKFNGKYLFSNSSGLYEYGGTSDNSSPIVSELATVASSFSTSSLKSIPSVYLGVDSTDSFILKVRVDGKGEVLYRLNKFTNNLQTQKIDIGKGLIGRYFQFEIITSASEFNMESIEFYPLVINRKI